MDVDVLSCEPEDKGHCSGLTRSPQFFSDEKQTLGHRKLTSI